MNVMLRRSLPAAESEAYRACNWFGHGISRSGPCDRAIQIWRPWRGATASFALFLLLCVLATGCKPADLETTYGRRRGNPGRESVNGTAALAGMFELAGHRVVTWRRLSPKLSQFQTIVWFPDDFKPPMDEQRLFLENWLGNQTGRTLIYVGRDYDATIEYWRKMQRLAPANQAIEVARRLAMAQAAHDRHRAAMPQRESCDWFVMRRSATRVTTGSLTGSWAAGIDGKKCELELHGRLEVPKRKEIREWVERRDEQLSKPPSYETVLAINDGLIAGRITSTDWASSQLIFVANGSFLLNLPLVNHEHRKLANHLIAQCGAPGRVAFLESEAGGPQVYDKEPGANSPTGFEVFTVWPLGVILVHLTALGILACVTLFPVFGRPRELAPRSSADFGQHIDALGELLEKTGDRDYANQRLQIYHEHVKRDVPIPKPKR